MDDVEPDLGKRQIRFRVLDEEHANGDADTDSYDVGAGNVGVVHPHRCGCELCVQFGLGSAGDRTGYYVMGSRSIVFAMATVNGVFMASESTLMKADDTSDSPDR
ncbi:hypothetical protein AB1286_28980 [Trinickia sp. NRRL B-1857]|uniref:hypothetical protein n=1 Tax=Trinickia sp. NRRL B-1857 TaxID=3162879 RepID=UPI003D26B43B